MEHLYNQPHIKQLTQEKLASQCIVERLTEVIRQPKPLTLIQRLLGYAGNLILMATDKPETPLQAASIQYFPNRTARRRETCPEEAA